MNEIIERATKAVVDYTGQRLPPAGDVITCEGIARAVLQAIREPDDHMIMAGIIERHDSTVPEACRREMGDRPAGWYRGGEWLGTGTEWPKGADSAVGIIMEGGQIVGWREGRG